MRLIIATLALAATAALASAPKRPDATAEYLTATMDDPIARLQKRLAQGEVKLRYEPQGGYLKALLKELQILPSSQMLVFSKTSLQLSFITPSTPRALYFNDNCWVGFVQGGQVLELMAQDPVQGSVFYTLAQNPNRLVLKRQTYECLQCHQSSVTKSIPGHVMRSLYVRADGQPDFSAGSKVTTDESPFEERWGGWYVTGTHGRMRHLGNELARGGDGDARIDSEAGANLTNLREKFDTSPYLTPHSDIVALLVAEHQGALQNLLTRASYLVRDTLADEAQLNAALKETGRRESTTRRIASACEPLVKALFFGDEAPLKDKVTGTTPFARQFAQQGPLDGRGRTLRDLDLQTRLSRYPLSWIIYSPPFDALPQEARAYVTRRIQEVLSGQDKTKDFAHLTEADRTAIREILMATKPALLRK
ncbi:hypothetical protein [Armatimonas sp.]|uniref:hypothetical protein n=1 Tax=Armatimonas sp. TaxID=1872638 RepID=UPI00286BB780|nr:hypothetical protein [Armatimonas sp.]